MAQGELINIERKTPLNFKPEDNKLFEQEWDREITISKVVEFNDVLVNHSIIFYKNFLPVHELNSQNLAYHSFPFLKTFAKTLSGTKIEINEAVWIIDGWSHGYFHWMTETLPRLVNYIRNHTGKSIVIPLPDYYKKLEFVEPSLKIFQASPYFYSKNEILKFKKLDFVTPFLPTGNFLPEIIILLKEKLLQRTSRSNGKPFKKIYISRRKASRRKVKNESEIETLLRKFNIETYCVEDLSFLSQAELLAQADFLVSNHGAGLTNMLFMAPGTKVLEFRKENDTVNNCYFSLASALCLDYLYLLSQPLHDGHDADVVVDPNLLENLLQQYC